MKQMIRTARSLNLDEINHAFRAIPLHRLAEFAVTQATFTAADTSTTIQHGLAVVPQFVFWLGETASVLYADRDDKLSWSGSTVTLKCDAIDSGLLVVGAV